MNNEQYWLPSRAGKILSSFLEQQGYGGYCTGSSEAIDIELLPDGVYACINHLPADFTHPIFGQPDSILVVSPPLEVTNTTLQLCNELMDRIVGATNSACAEAVGTETLHFFMKGEKVLIEGIGGEIIELPLKIFMNKLGYALHDVMTTTLPEVAQDLYEIILSSPATKLFGIGVGIFILVVLLDNFFPREKIKG